jgi:hypothetical protein
MWFGREEVYAENANEILQRIALVFDVYMDI